MKYKDGLNYLLVTIVLSITIGSSYASPIFISIGKKTTTQNGNAHNINQHAYKVNSKSSIRFKIPLYKKYKYKVILELSVNKKVKRGLGFFNINTNGNGIYKTYNIMASNEFISGDFKKIHITQEIISDKNVSKHNYYNLDISNNHNKSHFRVKIISVTATKL